MFKVTSLLVLLSACASNRVQTQIPEFKKENVCSDGSLHYLRTKNSSKAISSAKLKANADFFQAKMLNIRPLVKACYEQEMKLTNRYPAFNLCLVAGYSKGGSLEFSEFSSKEIIISDDLKKCLDSISLSKELDGLKDVTFLQPFRLTPNFQ